MQECNSCRDKLEKTTVRHDGYEILLMSCVSEGIYAVVGMNGETVIPSSETPETTEHITVRTEFGDDLVLAANMEKGFYTTSESEVRELLGEIN